LNGDGNPDILTANSADNSVSVLLGDGLGGFSAALSGPLLVGADPQSVVVADFNGDGKLDVATANSSANSVTVLLGDGLGGFSGSPGSPFAVGTQPQGLAVADLNGDGNLDIVTANTIASNVTILLGDGLGNFVAAPGSPFPVGTGPHSVAIADFNGDGKPDIVTSNSGNNTVTILLGNGLGGFGTPANFTAPGFPQSVAVGDFNLDGKPDVVTANSGGNNITYLQGDGLGGLKAGVQFGAGSIPYSLAVGDLNGDGKPDVVVANGGDNTLTILLGNGVGGFTQAGGSPLTVGSFPAAVAVSDFNGDGRADIAVANAGGNSVSVLLGQVTATSAALSTAPVSPVAAGVSVVLTLTVTQPSGGFSAPTGTVTFLDAATAFGIAAQTTSPFTLTTAGLGPGTHTLTANYGGDGGNAPSASNSVSLTVLQAAQTITFAALANRVLGAAPFNLTATASSGLAVTFSAAPATVCTGALATVTVVGAGTCTITAAQAGNTNYAAAPSVNQHFTVSQAGQTIAFGALATQAIGSAPFTLTATATSGLAVTFAAAPASACTVSGTTVTLVGAGTCTITASQAGNTNYAAAPSVNQHFTVTAQSQTITFGALANQAFGSAPFGVTATASSGLAVTFTATPAAVCTISSGTVTLAAAGTCTITAAQAGNSSYSAAPSVSQHFTVAPQGQTINFGALADQVFGIAPFTVSAAATSGLTVIFTSTTAAICTVNTVTVKLIAVGTCTLQAAQAGNSSFGAAPAIVQSFSVTQASQTITFGALMDQVFGIAAFTVKATASSGLTVAFTSTTTSVCTVSTATVTLIGVGACTVQASQPGSANYLPATAVGQLFNVTQANQTVKFAALSKQVFGAAPFTVTATATSTLPVGFASSTQGVCTVSQSTVTLVSAGSCTLQASQGGNADYAAATPVTQTFAVTPASQTITFSAVSNQTLGTAPLALSATASSGLDVAFASTTPAICTAAGTAVTLLSVGTCGIQASQPGNTNYAAAPSVSHTFSVAAAPLGAVNVAAVLNAGSYAAVPLAAASWSSIFGSNFSTTTGKATSATRPTSLAGATVNITDAKGAMQAAQLDYVSPGQINFLVPLKLAAGAANVTVTNAAANKASFGTVVATVSPSLFTADSSGAGPPAAIAVAFVSGASTPQVLPVFTCSGTPAVCTPTPIDLGTAATNVYLELFGTGIRGRSSLAGLAVALGGKPLQVIYAGAQSTFAGLDQVNVLLNRSLIGSGELGLQLTVDGVAANPVVVSIK
jgi:uncharacterized protein (TIGR03437 family)